MMERKKKKENDDNDSFESDLESVIQQSSGSSQADDPGDGLLKGGKSGKKKFEPTSSASTSPSSRVKHLQGTLF